MIEPAIISLSQVAKRVGLLIVARILSCDDEVAGGLNHAGVKGLVGDSPDLFYWTAFALCAVGHGKAGAHCEPFGNRSEQAQ